jgi:hypothetical protein
MLYRSLIFFCVFFEFKLGSPSKSKVVVNEKCLSFFNNSIVLIRDSGFRFLRGKAAILLVNVCTKTIN